MREALVSWFRENGRDLPWRRTRDPWRVLVSEVMLQQIQVKRAIPFYESFVARFPTVESLAAAPIAEAIRAWGDLGRYRRVVNLHRTARRIVDQHGGRVPSDPEVLVRLPGIGPYTAGAVACFAYERDVPFADTNMRRVLRRVFFGADAGTDAGAGAGGRGSAAEEREMLAVAGELVPPGRGWEWNQALMELGALRCAARRALCDGCPLEAVCRARPAMGSVAPAPREPRAKKGSGHRYEDSNRYYRGRVLARLRESEEGVDLRELGRGLRDGFGEEDLTWIRGVVESLQSDGLAVAEERAAYGEGEDPGEARVRLP